MARVAAPHTAPEAGNSSPQGKRRSLAGDCPQLQRPQQHDFEAYAMTTDYTGICKLLFDWQTLIAGLLALGAGILAYCAAQRQLRALKSTLQAESMIKLMEKFDSEAYEKKRETAAQACLSNLESRQPGTAVEDVLDFFDDAAFLVKIGALRKDMMW